MSLDVNDLFDNGAKNDKYFTEIESLCVNCMQQNDEEKMGTTRLLTAHIPFFRDILISSFFCDHCGYQNRLVEPTGDIEPLGVQIMLKLVSVKDLNRRIVRSKHAVVHIPHLESYFPCSEGSLSTIEGVLSEIFQNLTETLHSMRHREDQKEHMEKLELFLQQLDTLKSGGTFPFDIELEDTMGLSQIENYHAPYPDGNMKIVNFVRSDQQNEALGIYPSKFEGDDVANKDDVFVLPVPCPQCSRPCYCNNKLVDIPFFKEVLIMATNCDFCGYRENEVKGAAGIEPEGKRITLNMSNPSIDLKRDLLKSDTASLSIPEIDFHAVPGSLGGKFTTVEGILDCVKDRLESSASFLIGDSAPFTDEGIAMSTFLKKLSNIIAGEDADVHIVLDDPAGNAYIQNPFAPDADPCLVVETYTRSFEQNEELGLNDMKVDDYY